MSDLVERVARAIMKAFADNGKTAAVMSLLPQDATAAARAAIAALPPTGDAPDVDPVMQIYDQADAGLKAWENWLEENGATPATIYDAVRDAFLCGYAAALARVSTRAAPTAEPGDNNG